MEIERKCRWHPDAINQTEPMNEEAREAQEAFFQEYLLTACKHMAEGYVCAFCLECKCFGYCDERDFRNCNQRISYCGR